MATIIRAMIIIVHANIYNPELQQKTVLIFSHLTQKSSRTEIDSASLKLTNQNNVATTRHQLYFRAIGLYRKV